MKKLLNKILFLAGVAINAAAWAAGGPVQSADSTQNIYSEDKLNILVTVDQPQFTIKLPSNPTTGYSWYLREYDSNVVAPVKHHYQGGERRMMGAPGYEYWYFRVKHAGFIVPQQTLIRFLYARPWQGADNATQVTFRVTTQAK